MNKITREAIKYNIEYNNFKIKDLATLSGVAPKTISLVLSGKSKLTYDLAWKLDEAFNLPKNTLFNLQESEKKIEELKADKEMNEIANTIEEPEFERMDKISILQKISNMFKGSSIGNYKEYLSYISADFFKYKDKPLAYYWVAKMDNEYGTLKSKGSFKKSMESTVMKNTLDIMLSEEDIYERIEEVTKYLDTKGIILRNSKFIKNSTINGCVLKKDKQYFIFLNDKQKKEYQYIFALVHELLHIYGMESEDNNLVAKTIKEHMVKYDKTHEDLEYAMSEFKNFEAGEERYNNIHKNTTRRIQF